MRRLLSSSRSLHLNPRAQKCWGKKNEKWKIERMSFSVINYEIVGGERERRMRTIQSFRSSSLVLTSQAALWSPKRDIFQRLWSTVRLFGSLSVLFAHRHFHFSYIYFYPSTYRTPAHVGILFFPHHRAGCVVLKVKVHGCMAWAYDAAAYTCYPRERRQEESESIKRRPKITQEVQEVSNAGNNIVYVFNIKMPRHPLRLTAWERQRAQESEAESEEKELKIFSNLHSSYAHLSCDVNSKKILVARSALCGEFSLVSDFEWITSAKASRAWIGILKIKNKKFLEIFFC